MNDTALETKGPDGRGLQVFVCCFWGKKITKYAALPVLDKRLQALGPLV
jgi:hypothetical protein